MSVDLAHFRSRPDDCDVDPDGWAPLDDEWEYTAIPVLDLSQRLSDGVTPICAQLTHLGVQQVAARLGCEMLTADDVERLHAMATRGEAIELPAFTNTPTAESSLEHRIKSDEGNRANARRMGWRPGGGLCNFGKGWIAGGPWLMGWWVPNVRAYGITTRSGPGFVQPRPAPGSKGAHGYDTQADDGTNAWLKRRRSGGIGRKVSAFGAAIVAGAREIASALGGHILPAPVVTEPKKESSMRATIRLGSTGGDVSKWQAIVGVAVDGTFGPGTASATRAWQAARGLEADAVVGPASWSRSDSETRPGPHPMVPAVALGSIEPIAYDPGEVAFVRARNFRVAARPASSILWLVIHSMEAAEKPNTAENVATWFAGAGAPMASAHYCIDSDSVVQCVALKDVAFAAPGSNAEGIHIELAGYARQTEAEWLDEYSAPMLGRVAGLLAHLSELYGIPLEYVGVDGLQARQKGVTTHFDVSKAFKKSDHQDPGKGFPMAKVLAAAMAARAA